MHKAFFANMSRYVPDLIISQREVFRTERLSAKCGQTLKKRSLSTKQQRFNNLEQNICRHFRV